MIVGLLGLATVSAISARCAANTAEAIFQMAERTKYMSSQTKYGHTFVCQTNQEYLSIESALSTISDLSEKVTQALKGGDQDKQVIEKKLLEGVLQWGEYGRDLGEVLLHALDCKSTSVEICEEILDKILPKISLPARQSLLSLHWFREEKSKKS